MDEKRKNTQRYRLVPWGKLPDASTKLKIEQYFKILKNRQKQPILAYICQYRAKLSKKALNQPKNEQIQRKITNLYRIGLKLTISMLNFTFELALYDFWESTPLILQILTYIGLYMIIYRTTYDYIQDMYIHTCALWIYRTIYSPIGLYIGLYIVL